MAEMMMSKSIPVIDLQKFPDEEEYKKLREACEEWGCFRVMNHNVPESLMEEMKKVGKYILDLPMDIKKKNVDDPNYKGSGHRQLHLYESMGVYDPASFQALHNFYSQLDLSTYHRHVIEEYWEAIRELAVNIADKINKGYIVRSTSEPAQAMNFEDWQFVFKMNKYNFSPKSVGDIGGLPHTDGGFITILQDDEDVGGLEVFHPPSNSFVPVTYLPATLFINIGDAAHVWSNGRLNNVIHQVKCNDERPRYSVATFLLAPKNRNVEVEKEFVDSEHPPQFLPFKLETYIGTRVTTGLMAGEALDFMRTPQLLPNKPLNNSSHDE